MEQVGGAHLKGTLAAYSQSYTQPHNALATGDGVPGLARYLLNAPELRSDQVCGGGAGWGSEGMGSIECWNPNTVWAWF